MNLAKVETSFFGTQRTELPKGTTHARVALKRLVKTFDNVELEHLGGPGYELRMLNQDKTHVFQGSSKKLLAWLVSWSTWSKEKNGGGLNYEDIARITGYQGTSGGSIWLSRLSTAFKKLVDNR